MSNSRNKVVGLLVGRENTFPQPFIDMVNERGRPEGVSAELAVLGGTPELAEPRHAVLVDRISHEIPYYRAHLKSAALMGTVVINDPFWWEADEKFFECTLARRLGVAVPKTVVLPNKEYIDWDDYVRCICIGRTDILPIRYNPRLPFEERYRISEPVTGKLRTQAISQAQKLVEALGYDMDTVEFAMRDGVLYAIDFLNPAPDFDSFSIK